MGAHRKSLRRTDTLGRDFKLLKQLSVRRIAARKQFSELGSMFARQPLGVLSRAPFKGI